MHSYQAEDAPFFDYNISSVAGLEIRGAVPDLRGDYFVCVGAAQTFGRYVHTPYPDLLAQRLGTPSVNLSVGGAGPTLFQTDALLNVMNDAKFVIVQVLSARAESNTIFRSDGKSTLTVMIDGLRFSTQQDQSLVYSMPMNLGMEVPPDLTVAKGLQMHSTMAYQLLAECRDDVVCELAIQESKLRYVASMAQLLGRISVPKFLLYFSQRSPKVERTLVAGRKVFRGAQDIEGTYPHFVDEEVMGFIAQHADGVGLCVSKRGKPHLLPEGMTQLMPNGSLSPIVLNDYYPTPEMHEDAAEVVMALLAKN